MRILTLIVAADFIKRIIRSHISNCRAIMALICLKQEIRGSQRSMTKRPGRDSGSEAWRRDNED